MLASHAQVLGEFPVLDVAVVGAIACAAAALVAGGIWLWKHHGELLMRRPINEWTFTHMKLLLPATTVAKPAQPVPLPQRARPLEMTYEFDGVRYGLADLHQRTNTTAFVVLHRGAVVHESYPGRFASASTPLQLFSVTKSVTSMLIGIAQHEGAIKDITEPVVTYRPELAGTAYDGPTIEHLLDMSSGAGDLEDWTDPNANINRFEKAITTGGSLLDVVRGVERTTEPGVRFNYSTIDSQVLGWVLEAATGRSLAEYAADRLWRHIGMYFSLNHLMKGGVKRCVLLL